ncbi:hypothetical protein AYI69_g10467, partial [Smittium culicis]
IAQVGVVVSGSDGLPLQCHFDCIITADGHDRALGGIHNYLPRSDNALMTSNEVRKFSVESDRTTSLSANSSSGMRMGRPGTSTPNSSENMSFM